MIQVADGNSGDDSVSTNPKRLDPARFVRLAGLSWWFKDADIENLCQGHGKVVKVTIVYDRRNGKSTGDAEAEFEDSASAARAFAALKEHDFARDVQIEIISAPDTRPSGETLPSQNDNRKSDIKHNNINNNNNKNVDLPQPVRPPPNAAFPPNIFMPPGHTFPRQIFPPPGLPAAPPVGFPGATGFPIMGVPGLDPQMMWGNPGMPPVQQPILETKKREDHRGSGGSRRSRSWEHKDGESKRSRRDESPSGSRNKSRDRDRDSYRDRDRERSDDRHRHRDRRTRDRSRLHRESDDEDRRGNMNAKKPPFNSRDKNRSRSHREYDEESRRDRRDRDGERNRHLRG